MCQELNIFYSRNGHTLKLVEIERGQICLAAEEQTFYRVKITKIALDQVECFFLDEGRTQLVNKNALYRIKKDYLNVQFQVIELAKIESSRILIKTIKRQLSLVHFF